MLIDIHQFQVPIKCGKVSELWKTQMETLKLTVLVAQLTLKNDVLKGCSFNIHGTYC